MTHRPDPASSEARLVDPAGGRERRGSLLVDGRPSSPASPTARAEPGRPDGAEVVDCRGLVLAPGLVDMRAVTGEPGAEHRETLATAAQAAAAGGVTTVVCMPDTTPPIDDPAVVDFVAAPGPRHGHACDILPWPPSPRASRAQEMTEIGLLQGGRRRRLHRRRAHRS